MEKSSGGYDLDDITVLPCTRNFICASVGSGKSTVGCVNVEHYFRSYPHHRIYIVDYKRRFFAVTTDEHDKRLFPHGLEAHNYGTRRGVAIYGILANNQLRWRLTNGGIAIVQDEDSARELFRYIFKHQDIEQPILLYMDESFDALNSSGTRADADLRRIIQMGRELGIGTLIINQRPSRIDMTFKTESDVIYYGKLNDANDRESIVYSSGLKETQQYIDWSGENDIRVVPKYHWWKIDEENLEDSFYFKLNIPGMKAA